MQVAVITKTGEQVEVVAVNGGWTTVHTLDAATREMKVRNGELSKHATLSDMTAEIAGKKAEVARQARAKKPIEERLNGVVYAGYLPQYQSYKAALKDGTVRRSIDKGDVVAVELRGADLKVVYKKAAELTGLSVSHLLDRFAHLNPGMQRMNLGNMIRRIVYAQGAK